MITPYRPAKTVDATGRTNCRLSYAALLTKITDLTYVGEEPVDGLPAHHLQGTLPTEVMALFEVEDAPAESVMVDLWVGAEDSLMRRYQLVEPDSTSTFTLSRFGEAARIIAPVNPHPAEELARYIERPRFETSEHVKEEIAALSKPQQDCLRKALGDAAFAEVSAGTRLPTQEELRQGETCVSR